MRIAVRDLHKTNERVKRMQNLSIDKRKYKSSHNIPLKVIDVKDERIDNKLKSSLPSITKNIQVKVFKEEMKEKEDKVFPILSSPSIKKAKKKKRKNCGNKRRSVSLQPSLLYKRVSEFYEVSDCGEIKKK